MKPRPGVYQLAPAEFGAPLRNLVAAHKIISLQDFLGQRPELLDSPSREIYRAYSYALVSLLTNGPEDSRSSSPIFPEASGDSSDLIGHFKKFDGSIENAERVWNANIAQLATSNGYESFHRFGNGTPLDTTLYFQFPKSRPWTNFGSSKIMRILFDCRTA